MHVTWTWNDTYVVSQNQHFILPSDESMLLVGFGAKRPYYKCTKRRWRLTGRRVSAAGTRPGQELLDERKWAEGINKERRRVMEEDHSSVVQTTRIYSCKVWIRMKFCSFDDKVEWRYWRWRVRVDSPRVTDFAVILARSKLQHVYFNEVVITNTNRLC